MPYQTLDEAVYYAAEAAREIYADRQEAMSLVYEKEGQFFFTPPASRQRSSKDVRTTVAIPKGSLRFIVHNHPAGEGQDTFPEEDLAAAERLKVPSAITFGRAASTIRVFRPGVTAVIETLNQGTRTRQSKGEDFLFNPFTQISDEVEADL